MAGEVEDDEEFDIKFREDEELEFFTELAVHETERWIQAVTKKTFQFPEDPRKSLENGVLLCELVNCIEPGTIRRINRLPTPIAGLDNVNVFLRACKSTFHLNDTQLFDSSDLEDLSQRAIGESDRLKDEYDKRLRNVAVSIYWLGRYAHTHYQGPQLDQSAFSALVHHKHDAEILERDYHHSSPASSNSNNTWDWTHAGSGVKAHSSHQNARDGSVDSFGKESVDSLEDSVSPSRYSNTSAASRSSDRDFPSAAQHDGQSDNMYPTSNRHHSSTDSLNGSNHSGHSRQGSDSVDAAYPTRRMSAQMTRKSSTTVDPLQFIKDGDYDNGEEEEEEEEVFAGKSSTDLAETAEVQMRIAAQSKKIASETKVQEEEPVDWQANLSTWKTRRKSQSAVSYQMKEDLERMEKEKEGEQTSNFQTKTFSQMQEERERRKSLSRHFYPIEDDDDNLFSPPTQITNSEKNKAEVIEAMHKPKAEVAPWARDSPENQTKEQEEEEEDNVEDEDESGSEPDDINNNDDKENGISPSRNNDLRSAPSRAWRSADSDQFIQKTQAMQQNSISSHPHHSLVETKRTESFKSSTTNVGPRTQSKIGSLLQNFQQASNKTALPKEGYKETIDLSARKNIFEQSENDSYADKARDVKPYNDSKWGQDKTSNRIEQEEPQIAAKTSDKRLSDSFKEDEGEDKLVQIEKTIKISQKPNNDKGFGFFLTGGADQGRPLCVSKVSLGSAADLCELKVKDEILRVNQTDANGKTASEVGDVIGRAVSAGFIELRVKRTCTSDELDELEEEDMTSSSDEGEEDFSVPEPIVQNNQPSNFSSRFDNTQKISEPAPDPVIEKIEVTTRNMAFSAPSPENNAESGKDDDGPPAFLRKWQRQRQREEYTFDSGPSTDYSKISLNSGLPRQQSNDRIEMSQDSNLNYSQPSKPWDDRLADWTAKQDKERQPDAVYSSHGANDQAQFNERQEEIKSAYEDTMKVAEEKADERMKQEQTFLQPELDKARILEERRMERRNRIQETAAALSSQPPLPSSSQPPLPSSSQPPLPSSSSSSASSSFSNLPLPSSFLPVSSTSRVSPTTKRWQTSYSPDTVTSNSAPPPSNAAPGSHVTSMSFDIGAINDSSAPMSYAFPKQQGVIVIDPRNQAEKQQPMTPLEFQIKLPPKQDVDQNSLDFLEAERERIRQEERRKVEEERMKEQRDWEAKQEELRKMEEKERVLREQEEMLRLEREKFQREQEEFKRIREQQLREQQQIAYHAEQKQQQHPVFQQQQQPQLQQQQQYQPQHEMSPPPQPPSHPMYQNLYPSSQQFENYHQHLSQFKQPPVSQEPKASSQQQQPGAAYYQANAGNAQPSYSKPSWSNNNSQPERPKGYRQGGGNAYSQVQPPSSFSSSEPDRYHRGEQVTGGRFSKEDMLAMNRKATPDLNITRKSPENHLQQQHHQQQQQQQHHHQQQHHQQQQQQPRVPSPNVKDTGGQSKGHTLNSAPKARLRDDSEWQDPNRQVSSRITRGRAEDGKQPKKSAYSNSQEHWLIQEAERRRLAESDGRIRGQPPVSQGQVLYPGPIKPQNDDMGNRWRNNADKSPNSMPHAIRKTLLQKTSTARGPEPGNNGYPGEHIPPHHQQHYQQQQQHHQPQMMSQQHQLPQSLSPRSNNPYQAGSQEQLQYKGSSHVMPVPSEAVSRYSPNSGYPPSNSHHAPPLRQQPTSHEEGGLPVNGNQLCSHCNQELGFGAAMVIESLGIFFHLQCFRCCVCHASLGTGSQGADVRVRMNKLHCPNCYSNDEAGLKFSKV